MRAVFISLVICVAGIAARAQSESQPVRGPIVGFVFDDLKDLRPILGIAGAATIGEPIPVSFRFSSAVLAPGQKYVIGTTVESAEVVVLKLDGFRAVAIPVEGALANPDAIAVSPDAASVALYSESRRIVQIITGLPDAPGKLGDFDLSGTAGILRSLAISDAIFRNTSSPVEDNDVEGFRTISTRRRAKVPVLALAFSGDGRDSADSQFYALDPENGLSLLPASSVSAAAFLPDSPDVVVLDSLNQQVVVLRDVLGAAAVELLANAENGVQKPSAISVSSDGRRGFVLNGGSADIVVLDFAKRVVTLASCPCLPSQLAPLATSAVFGLTQRLDKPIWILDGRNDSVNFVFVPAYVR